MAPQIFHSGYLTRKPSLSSLQHFFAQPCLTVNSFDRHKLHSYLPVSLQCTWYADLRNTEVAQTTINKTSENPRKFWTN